MKRVGTLFACVVLMSAFACDNRGGEDTGIVIMDSGMRDTASGDTGVCAPVMVPAPTMAACTMATGTCLSGCTTAACQQGCLDADPNAMSCNACVNQAVLSAASMMGCAQPIGDLECCVNDRCGGSATGCTACDAEIMAISSCIMTMVTGTINIGPCISTTMALPGPPRLYSVDARVFLNGFTLQSIDLSTFR